MKRFRLLLLVASALLAVGCLPGFTGNATGPRLAYFGDSISTDAYAGTELDAALRVDNRIIRHAHSGWRLDQQLLAAETMRSSGGEQPSVQVVNLGTNDAIQIASGTWTMDQTVASIEAWRHTFPGTVTCRVFVLPSNQTLNPNINTVANSIIAYLRSLNDPSIRLADWGAVVHDVYVSTPAHEYIVADGVHPTQHGQDLLAELTRSTVATCPATVSTTTTTTDPTTTTTADSTTTTFEPTTTTTEPETTTTTTEPESTTTTTTEPETTTTTEPESTTTTTTEGPVDG